jgi:preprotein translocase subunit SecA
MAQGDDRLSERYRERLRKEEEHRKQLPTEEEPKLPPPVEPIHKDRKDIGRNDPCPCGSGKKYKQCCLKKE